jgi:hypothetical protein
METIAVYWEPVIKTYGFEEATELALICAYFKTKRMTEWGFWIWEIGSSMDGFRLVLLEQSDPGGFHVYLLVDSGEAKKILSPLDELIQTDTGEYFNHIYPVDLIYFQGPHFGDRYGIADAVFKALAEGNIPVHITACSGASVYLVLPKNKRLEAIPLLHRFFHDPRTGNHKTS